MRCRPLPETSLYQKHSTPFARAALFEQELEEDIEVEIDCSYEKFEEERYEFDHENEGSRVSSSGRRYAL
jgi:hypothetical protein